MYREKMKKLLRLRFYMLGGLIGLLILSIGYGCSSESNSNSEYITENPTRMWDEVEEVAVDQQRIDVVESKKIKETHGDHIIRGYPLICTIIKIDGHEYSVVTTSNHTDAGISQLHLESCQCNSTREEQVFMLLGMLKRNSPHDTSQLAVKKMHEIYQKNKN